MNEFFKKYLLASTAVFSPPDAGGGGDNPDQGDDRIELQDDDDETVTDPVDEDDQTEQDDDEDTGGEDDSAARGAGGGDPSPARQSRGDRQFGELRRQARERAEENAKLTRRLAEMEGRLAGLQQAPQETAAQRAERLALMSPEERIQESVNEALRAHEQRSQTLQTQLMDQSDRVAFEARATNNPLFKKLSSEVERRLADLRSRGQNLPRETIATYLIGERVIAQQGKSKPAADARRRQQRAAPVRAQGDTTAPRQRRGGAPVTAEDYEAQFGDVTI